MFWLPCARLVKITVWHGDTVTGAITNESVLAAFEAIWSEKIKQPKSTRATFRHSLDLQMLQGNKYRSTRWLYDSNGFAKVMVIPNLGFHVPVYAIPAPEDLNRLIGIAP